MRALPPLLTCNCLRDTAPLPAQTRVPRPCAQVAIFLRKVRIEHAVERMKALIDSQRGHELIAKRFATVEPVFRSIRFNKALNRFTLRGRGSYAA